MRKGSEEERGGEEEKVAPTRAARVLRSDQCPMNALTCISFNFTSNMRLYINFFNILNTDVKQFLQSSSSKQEVFSVIIFSSGPTESSESSLESIKVVNEAQDIA